MSSKGPQGLPGLVILETKPEISASELSAMLNRSRAALHAWRKKFNFPRPIRSHGRTTITPVRDVAAWLTRHNVQVKWV